MRIEKPIHYSEFLVSNGIFYFEVLKKENSIILQGALFNRFDYVDYFNSGTEIAEKHTDNNIIGVYDTNWFEFHKKGPVKEKSKLKIEVKDDLYNLLWFIEDEKSKITKEEIFKGQAKLFKIEEKEVLIGHYKYIG